METENSKHVISARTGDEFRAVFGRISDVMGLKPKRRLFGGTGYSIQKKDLKQDIMLSSRTLRMKAWRKGTKTAFCMTRLPLNGKAVISYSENCSVLIIKSYDGMTAIVQLGRISEDAAEYIATGTVTQSRTDEKPRPAPAETPLVPTEEKPTFTIIRNADVPPMESFSDYGKPYGNAARPKVIPNKEKPHQAIPCRKPHPFHRWNEEIVARAKGRSVEVYTDGGLRPEQDRLGGWAFAVLHSQDVAAMQAGTETGTTITRMELKAAAKALHALVEIHPLEAVIYTDSQYVRNGAEVWWKGWLNEDGTFKDGIKDADLWADIINTRNRLGEMHCDVTFTWIKGHSGNRWNTYVDAKNKEVMDAWGGNR